MAGIFLRLAEPLIGTLEERLLRLGQQFVADLRELRRQRILRLDQLCDTDFETPFALSL